MQTKERILTIRLMDKFNRKPIYTKELGLGVTKKTEKDQKQKVVKSENFFRP